MISLSMSSDETKTNSAVRAVNLRTDLLQLADLMEVAFNDRMDDQSRRALQDMRLSSQFGILGRINELALGINKGFVWVDDGRVVGNVSLVPANWPSHLGKTWMIVNVAVLPDYRRQGIARELMIASMKHIKNLGGRRAILQVDYDNSGAVHLYENLGFVRERAFTTWTRSSYTQSPPSHNNDSVFITHPRSGEWQAEYELAQSARPEKYGGIGWERPLHIKYFRLPFWKRLLQIFTFSGTERLIVRDESEEEILATLWIERSIALTRTRLTFMQRPNTPFRYVDALFSTVLRRHHSSGFVVEHPHDDVVINDLLTDHNFRVKRTLWHMRYDF